MLKGYAIYRRPTDRSKSHHPRRIGYVVAQSEVLALKSFAGDQTHEVHTERDIFGSYKTLYLSTTVGVSRLYASPDAPSDREWRMILNFPQPSESNRNSLVLTFG